MRREMRERVVRQLYADNYFFAARPDAETAEKIAEFAARFRKERGLRGRLISAERLHISLCGIRYLPPSVFALIKEAAERTPMPPFDIMFNHVMSYERQAGGRPLVLCEYARGQDETWGVHQLHKAVRQAMMEAGLHNVLVRKSFNPHVTLLYGEHDIPQQEVDEFVWRVETLTLIRSLQGLSTYEVLEEWPLRGHLPVVPPSAVRSPHLIRPVPPYNFSEDATSDD